VLVGGNSSSEVYVRIKKKACEEIGIINEIYRLDKDESTQDLKNFIHFLNHDREVHGILVQLPLPSKYNELEIVQTVNPRKDVDGFHFDNVGKISNAVLKTGPELLLKKAEFLLFCCHFESPVSVHSTYKEDFTLPRWSDREDGRGFAG
jgi:hypothetical protein